MSDPTIEEDSLISQSDIDKLLESSSIDEAEDKFATDDGLMDELGELSQDDIDNLMNANLSAPADSPDKPDILEKLDTLKAADKEDDEMELISQDDIDQLMNSNMASTEDPALQNNPETGLGEEDFGELSQDDIDGLMNSNLQTDVKTPSSLDDDEEFEEFSKDDIKILMGTQQSGSNTDSPLEDKADHRLNLEDDDILRDEKIEEIPLPVKENRNKADDDVISESEAAGVADCLISQATMDDLIKNFNAAPADSPVILDEDLPDAAEPKITSGADEFEMQTDKALTDDEDYLKPARDTDVLELNDDREDVTQEDIDALLTESDDEEEAEDDILISQDDIDTLLMAADQEDEDVLGDILDKGLDTDLDEGLEEDLLAQESIDEAEEEDDEDVEDDEDNEDQVVLQGDDDVAVKLKKKKKKPGPAWYKKKLALAFASLLVILGITVPVTYFLFWSDGQKDPEIVVNDPQKPVVKPQKEVEIEIETVQVPIPVKPPADDKIPGNMVLKGFVVLAPDVSKKINYIITDVSIDYADQKALQEIRNNLSYFRDMIYDSISKTLSVDQQDSITEEEILSVVETTLKKALPANSINRVSFVAFKIS